MTLVEITENEIRTISHFTDEEIGGKLICMGLKPGSRIQVVRKTTGSQTYYVKTEKNRLAIRANEAAVIELT